jgi:hypothetical protein
MNRRDYISASEIGDFTYCKRGWWLNARKLLPVTPEMQKGAALHVNLSNQVVNVKSQQKTLLTFAGILTVIVVVLIIIFILSQL